MDKITKKFIRYFIFIISIVISICFLVSSLFLSKYYLSKQYSDLKKQAEEIYSTIKSGNTYNSLDTNAFLIKDSKLTSLTKGKIGIQLYFKSLDYASLPPSGKIQNNMKESFLYYKLNTNLGYIFVFKNAEDTSNYLNIAYVILLLIFITTIIFSIPLIAYIGKKFTNPILKLKIVALQIKNGDFSTDISISSNDEIQDLSESIKDMAKALKERQSLQRDFVANVSHDFKTPLSIIRNYSEAIYDDILDAPDRQKYANEIISEVDRLNSLVVDLLELSKLQSTTSNIDKHYINLDLFLRNCITKFETLSLKKNIKILYKFYISKDTNILCNEKSLSRVIYNFIDNALKFSHSNEEIHIICSEYNTKIKISIKDFGEGISKNELKNIWDKYYKHAKSGGMGLGLPICSEILKLHNFEYGVESTISKGSTFYFLIPKSFIK